MKIKRKLLAVLCVILCCSMVFPSGVYAAPTAKQMIIEAIKAVDFAETSVYTQVSNQLYSVSAGSYKMKLHELSGELLPEIEELRGLNGASLDLDYKLNSPKKQFALDYDLKMNQTAYQGAVYATDKEFVFTAQAVVDFLRKMEESYAGSAEHSLLAIMEEYPQYFYLPLEGVAEVDEFWAALNQQGTIPPETKDFLLFFLEAIPDQYFSFSLADQSFVFALDSAGLADVIHAITVKAANEPDRLAETFAAISVFTLPESEQETAKSEIKAMFLSRLQELNTFEIPTTVEFQQEIEKVFVLNSLRLEKSLLSKDASFSLNGDFVGDDFSGNPDGYILIDSNVVGNADNYNGSVTCNAYFASEYLGAANANFTMKYHGDLEQFDGAYELYVTAQDEDSLYESIADFEASGTYKYTLTDAVSNNVLKASLQSGGYKMLGLSLDYDFTANYNQEVVIETPELTPANSVNYFALTESDSLAVYLDGIPLETYPMYGETLVPLRQVAEQIGCQVEWIEPDEIIITRDDTTVVMHLYHWTYLVNGEERDLEASTTLVEDRAFTTFWALTDAFNCPVSFRLQNNSLQIRSR